jgi:hypothetical protein
MISSEEFQQKLQAGDIQAALALVVREAIALDVTTRLTATAVTNGSINNREYLRTKINLLTGEIQNEVGKDLVTDGSSYIKLQQLHIDQIVASHRIVQGYLHQIKAILMVLSPSSISTQPLPELDRDSLGERLAHSLVSADRSNPDALTAKLTQAANTIANNASRHQVRLDTQADSIVTDLPQPKKLSNPSNFTKHIAPVDPLPISTVSSIESPIDDDIDLSVAKDGEVWEEWIETEESIISEPIATPQPASATIPDWEEQWVRRSLNPIEVKPMLLRSTSSYAEPSSQWDKFVPEYIGIGADSPAQISSNDRSPGIENPLANLDV